MTSGAHPVGPGRGSGASRRAPRLGPEDRLAPHLRRRGRFAGVDPLKPRRLPSWPRVVGVVGWAALLGGALYKARSTVNQPADAA